MYSSLLCKSCMGFALLDLVLQIACLRTVSAFEMGMMRWCSSICGRARYLNAVFVLIQLR